MEGFYRKGGGARELDRKEKERLFQASSSLRGNGRGLIMPMTSSSFAGWIQPWLADLRL